MNVKKIILSALTLSLFFISSLFASEKLSPDTVFKKINTYLIENSGQYPSEILYTSYPANVSILKDRIVVQGVEIIFKKANENVNVKPTSKQEAAFNYYVGNAKSKWRSNVASYENVEFENIYKNVDLNFTGIKNGNIEFQWKVKPYADLSNIIFEIKGAEVKNNGKNLEIIKENKILFTIDNLKAYQGAEEREASFKTINNVYDEMEFGYLVNDYKPECMLVIDPDLSNLLASTFLGGSGEDYGNCLAIDTLGNVFVLGNTNSFNIPIVGGYDNTFDDGGFSNHDVFVAKFDNTLNSLLASTFLGTDDEDLGNFLALDASGNVFVTGYTESGYFPTVGGYDNTANGGNGNGYDEAFISKLDNTLSSLLASTYFGGSDGSESGTCLIFDTSGNVFVTGQTSSTNIPIVGGYDSTFQGSGQDVFVAKFNNTLSSLLASTYYGGVSTTEEVGSIAIDTSGNIFIAGSSYGSNYQNVFIVKLNSTLSSLSASTSLSYYNASYGNSMVIDASGNVFIVGNTEASDFPIVGGYDNTFQGSADVFIAKFNNTLSSLLASTYLGGGYFDYGNSIAVDSSGNVFVTGSTNSSDFPIVGGYDGSVNVGNNYDVFVAKFNNTLSSLLASTYLGESEQDYGAFIAIDDASGNIFVTGNTESSNFPTVGGYSNYFTGSSDAFLSKFNNDPSITAAISKNENSFKNKFTFKNNSINFNIIKSTYIGVDIYETNGALVKSISYGFVNTGNYEINMSDLNIGPYIAKIRMGEEVKGEKFIIIK